MSDEKNNEDLRDEYLARVTDPIPYPIRISLI